MSHKLLCVENLTIQNKFSVSGKQGERILENISFELQKGEVLAIIGETGSGKTLTAKAIMGVLPDNLLARGKVDFSGQNLMACSASQMQKIRGRKIGMAFQNPETALNQLLKNKKQMNLVMNSEISYQIQRLNNVGLRERGVLKLFPFELSGGMAQRFMTALGLGYGVELVIFDEPTRGLDAKTRSTFVQLIKTLSQKHNIAVIIITHDLDLLERTADHCLILAQGKVESYGLAEDMLNHSKSMYIENLLNSDPRKKDILDRKVGTKENARFKFVRDEALEVSQNIVLEVKHLKSCYRYGFIKKTEHPVLEDVNFSIYKGESVGLIGDSGSGKSTLAACILGLQNYSGEIVLNGKLLSKKINARAIAVIRQSTTGAFNPVKTIRESLMEIFTLHPEYLREKKANQHILSILEDVGMEELYKRLDDYPAQFSGGQLQRFAIARTLLSRAELIILDEVSSMLDLLTQAKIMNLLNRLRFEKKLSYLFISHDLPLAKQFCDRTFRLENGCVSNVFYPLKSKKKEVRNLCSYTREREIY